MFRLFKDLAVVLRSNYIDGKSTPLPTGNSYNGYLKPLKPDDSLYQGAFGKDYSYTTNENADIKEGDTLEISGEKYNVKGIAKWEGISVKYKKLLLVKK